nr:hypothetical protein Iba_chr07cCG7440 [Ipomoea batatas]
MAQNPEACPVGSPLRPAPRKIQPYPSLRGRNLHPRITLRRHRRPISGHRRSNDKHQPLARKADAEPSREDDRRQAVQDGRGGRRGGGFQRSD